MMEHIRQFDWYQSSTPEPYFVSESALDNCNVEAIVMDNFFDPLNTSSEEDEEKPTIDWDDVFKTRNFNKNHSLFVPGMQRVAPYPKLSAMSGHQHYRGLRVLCAMNPTILEEMQFHSPTMADRHNFEQLKEIYDKEKKEYIEWAKTQWVTHHCVRALRPKPAIETTYEAEFKVRAQRLSGYPQRFEMAAQIPLECTRGYEYQTILKDTLIDVPVSDLPQVHLPKPIMRNSTIITPCSLPEPCHKHPYQFILPNEKSVSILPIKEVHRELAQYAAENGTRFIASENALRCLVEFNRSWNIPVTVCSAFNNDGERINVVVLDSEFLVTREPAVKRTFRAFRHLLEHALVPSSEKQARLHKVKNKRQPRRSAPAPEPEPDCSSDDEPLGLCIMDEGELDPHTPKKKLEENPETLETASVKKSSEKKSCGKDSQDGADMTSPVCKNNAIANGDISKEDIDDIIGVYNCTCSDTPYEVPPPRSFKKWQFTNNNTLESIDVIVHCSHKARLDSTELLLEPIPEYQLELGGSEQPPDRIRSIALSLMLRNNASVLNARVDGYNGDMVTLDAVTAPSWRETRDAACGQVRNVLHTALAELQGLVPGHYVLQHEPSHGSNALLLVARGGAGPAALQLPAEQPGDAHEAAMARAPPTLAPVLLPYHKFRKILPCAFTPHEHFLAKESKKPPSKQKSPPQAIQWPKRKNRKQKQKK